MKLKNIKVGDTLEVKNSIVDEVSNDCLEPEMLCKVIEIEEVGYCGSLTVRVAFDGDTDWVSHRHLRKPRPKLTGSDLTRKMLADGENSVLCYVSDTSDDQAIKGRITKNITAYKDGWFITGASILPWVYAVPVEEVPVEEVMPLSRWTHGNGSIYTAILITNEHSENQDRYPTTVVYRDCDYEVWSKPLSEWHRSMTKMED